MHPKINNRPKKTKIMWCGGQESNLPYVHIVFLLNVISSLLVGCVLLYVCHLLMVSIVIFTFVPVSHRSAIALAMVIPLLSLDSWRIFAVNWLFILFHCYISDSIMILKCFFVLLIYDSNFFQYFV